MTNKSYLSSHVLARITARLLVGGRRRNLYVGGALQRRLIAALVIMEAVLVAASICLLYRYMNGIIDEHLYRVHLAAATPLWPLLIKAAFVALAAFVAVNGVFLLMVMAVWGRYVNSIMARFMTAMKRAGRLDFRSKPAAAHRHEVMALAETWLSHERQRVGAIWHQIAGLELAVAGQEDRQELARRVDRLLELVHPTVDDAGEPDATKAREDPA